MLLVSVMPGCVSSARPESVAQPTLAIARIGGPSGSGVTRQLRGAFSLSFALQVRNEADVPLGLYRVELESVGPGAYEIARVSQAFDRTIAPGATETVEMWAVAVAGRSVTGLEGPVTIRAIFHFEAEGETFREVLTRNLRGGLSAR